MDPSDLAEILAAKLRIESKCCGYYGQTVLRDFLNERANEAMAIKDQIIQIRSKIDDKSQAGRWRRLLDAAIYRLNWWVG